jgi:regulator of cell morphogenesis and NO signaling
MKTTTQPAHLTDLNTVGEWVVDRPARSRIFERLGIDYCCGGKRPLREATEERGLDTAAVIAELLRPDAVDASAADATDWTRRPLAELIEHIVGTHHAYLQSELPRLLRIVEKVAEVHGPRHEELLEVARIFGDLKEELDAHLMKEEQVLFPMIRELETAATRPSFHCGSVGNPIRVMEYEHDGAGDALGRLRELTAGYACPPDGCNTWRAMCDGLRQLEADLHQHIHKENNILFPRAVQVEGRL